MEIGYKIDDEDRVEIVQGEDRVLKIRLFDAKTGIPLDLTSANIKFECKSRAGGVIKKTSANLSFVDADLDLVANTIKLSKHGLVKNQIVEFLTTDTLPSDLDLLTFYYVIVIDEDHISLAAAKDGTAIDITAADGTGTHSIDTPLITMTGNDPVLGTISVPLDDSITEEMKAGKMQTPEVEYTIGSTTRVVQLLKALTVLEQVV